VPPRRRGRRSPKHFWQTALDRAAQPLTRHAAAEAVTTRTIERTSAVEHLPRRAPGLRVGHGDHRPSLCRRPDPHTTVTFDLLPRLRLEAEDQRASEVAGLAATADDEVGVEDFDLMDQKVSRLFGNVPKVRRVGTGSPPCLFKLTTAMGASILPRSGWADATSSHVAPQRIVRTQRTTLFQVWPLASPRT